MLNIFIAILFVASYANGACQEDFSQYTCKKLMLFPVNIPYSWTSCDINADCGGNGLICSEKKICVCPALGNQKWYYGKISYYLPSLILFKAFLNQECDVIDNCVKSRALKCDGSVCKSMFILFIWFEIVWVLIFFYFSQHQPILPTKRWLPFK